MVEAGRYSSVPYLEAATLESGRYRSRTVLATTLDRSRTVPAIQRHPAKRRRGDFVLPLHSRFENPAAFTHNRGA